MTEGPETQPNSPEASLAARLRVQRLVFGAFAAVLVAAAVTGLAAYRTMQATTRHAESRANSALADLDDETRRHSETSRGLGRARTDLEALGRELGAAQARAAILHADRGEFAQAAKLLQESLRNGPPAWWPVANSRMPQPVPSIELAGSPTCGAATPDGQRIAVAVGGDVAAIHVLSEGATVASSLLPEGVDEPAHLVMREDGSALVAACGGRLFWGDIAPPEIRLVELPVSAPGRVLHMTADPTLSRLIASRGREGLQVCSRIAGRWGSRMLALNGDARAALEDATGMWVVSRTELIRVEGAAHRVIAPMAIQVESARLAQVAGGVALTAFSGDESESLVLRLPDQIVARLRGSLPAALVAAPSVLPDGTVHAALAGYLSLRAAPGQEPQVTAGRTPLIVLPLPQGAMLGGAAGKLYFERDPLPGQIIARVAPGLTATALPHGFALAGEAHVSVWAARQTRLIGEAGRALLAGPEPVIGAEGEVRMSGRERPGVLLGAGDGVALLWHEGRLNALRADTENTLAMDLPAPTEAAVSAGGDFAVLRLPDGVWQTDLEGPPRRVLAAGEFAARMIAVAGRGGAFAAADEERVLVRASGAEHSVPARPDAMALLFDGTVLALTQDGTLRLVEAASGLELARYAWDVDSLAATPDDALLVVVAGTLRRIDFPRSQPQ